MVRCSPAGTKRPETMPDRPATLALLILCLCTTSTSRAEELWDWEALSRSPSVFMVEGRSAAGGGQNLYASLDLNTGDEGRLMLYLNRSRAAGQGTPLSDGFGIAITSATDRLASLSLGADYLDQEQTIQIDSYHLTLALAPGDWLLSLGTERRRITLHTSTTLQRYRPQFKGVVTQSRSTTLRLGYYGWEAWSVSLYQRREHYEANLEALSLRPRLSQLLFTQAALNAAWNLTQRQQGLSLSRYFERSDLTASYNKSWSAVDGEPFVYLSLRFGYELSNDLRIEIEGGGGFAVTEERRTNNSYGALALLRSW